MAEIEVSVHWFGVTIWCETTEVPKIWLKWFQEHLGLLERTPNRGRFFQRIDKALNEAKVYSQSLNAADGDFAHFEFPGKACESLPPQVLSAFVAHLESRYRYQVTRLDVAFDHLGFTPLEFFEAVSEGHVRTLAKRDTLEFYNSPYQAQEQGGEVGCMTASFGSRTSTRSLRVYNRRGFTRLEIEYRKERADAVSRLVLLQKAEDWPQLMTEHLLDYIDLLEDGEGGRLAFWEDFVQENKRAKLTISDARQMDLNKTLGWLDKQVSPALSVVNDVIGEQAVQAFVVSGRRKRGARYKSLIDTEIKREEPDED